MHFKVLGLVALPVVALAALMMVMSFDLGSADKAEADSPHAAGLEFHLAIAGGGATCSTAPDVKGVCVVPSKSTLTAEVFLDDISGIGNASYNAVAFTITSGDNTVVSNKAASTADVTWPDCVFAAEAKPAPGSLNGGCATGIGAPASTFTGKIGEADFNCGQSGATTLTLVHSGSDTLVIDSKNATHSEAGPDVLNVTCAPATATPTTPPTATPAPNPRMFKADNDVKVPDNDPNGDNLSSIFMTRQGPKLPPTTCTSGTSTTVFEETLNIPIPEAPDPKDPNELQQLGAFEFEIRFDDKIVCVELIPGTAADDMICIVEDDVTAPTLENLVRIGCVTQGKENFPDTTTPEGRSLARIVVRPTEDTFNMVRPNQDNGITVQLLNQDCELADLQGHPIQIFSCEDAEITIRFLEGDVAGPDCAVDALDTQTVAFRWGATLGSLVFNSFFDLEPSGQVNGDGDIDIKDLQFVFGRFGSTCKDQWPPQPPINPKA